MSSQLTADQLIALTKRIYQVEGLEQLSARELVFVASHLREADAPEVAEMMRRLDPAWTEAECPPNCALCKQRESTYG